MLNINELSPDEVRALARLKQLGGERVLEVIQKFADYETFILKKADETVRIYRQQGRAGAYEDLVKAVNDAATIDARSNRV